MQDEVHSVTNGLRAQQSRLGKVIFGELGSNDESELLPQCFSATITDYDLDRALRRLWEIEEIQGPAEMSSDQRWVEDHFVRTHYRTTDGQYVVHILIKPDRDEELGDSYYMARRQFESNERRLQRQPEVWAKYVDFMREYLTLGHMQLATEPYDAKGRMVYIPHHAVLPPAKFRVVFNASAQTSSKVSFNDIVVNRMNRD